MTGDCLNQETGRNRRSFLLTLGVTATSTTMLSVKQALAQDDGDQQSSGHRDITTLRMISSFADRVQAMLADKASEPLYVVTDSNYDSIYEFQKENAIPFVGQLFIPIQQQIDYVPGAQIDVALSMQAKQVAILPTIETITLFNPAPSVVQTPKTSIVEVIFDIFCSTLHNAETLERYEFKFAHILS